MLNTKSERNNRNLSILLSMEFLKRLNLYIGMSL